MDVEADAVTIEGVETMRADFDEEAVGVDGAFPLTTCSGMCLWWRVCDAAEVRRRA